MKNYKYMNKLVVYVIALAIAASFSFSLNALAEDRVDTEKYENGQPKYTIVVKDDQRHGNAIWYYEDGQISEQGNYAFGLQEGMWKKFHADGTLYEERPMSGDKLEGMYKEYYQSGAIKRELLHAFNLQHGASTWYYESGQISEEGGYVENVKEGMWLKYHRNGNIYEERPTVYNRLEGMYKEYYTNGTIKRELPHTFNLQNGHAKWYYENGRVSEEGEYAENVKEGMWLKYHANGKLYEERPTVYNRLEGMYKEYYQSGAIKRELPHKFNIQDGHSKWYYENGRVSEEGGYGEGVKEGMWLKYHANGRLYEERPTENGLLEGMYKEYYQSGSIKRELPHVNNVQHGLGKWYGEDGKLTETAYHEGGNQVELEQLESTNNDTGEKTTSIENPDGSRTVTKTDKNGKVTSREVIGEKPDIASSSDEETGITTTATENRDGTREVAETDPDVNRISRAGLDAARPDDLPFLSATNPQTGVTTSSVLNEDGSRTVTKTDADGNILEQEEFPPRGTGLASGTLVDPETGDVTTVTTNADGTRNIAKSKVTRDDDGTEYTTAMDDQGNKIVSTITPEGVVITTKTDKHGNITDTIMNDDGSLTSVERTVTGYTTETTRDADGHNMIVKKDMDGSVMQTVEKYPDGTTVTVDKYGNSVEVMPVDEDGEIVTLKVDNKGNQNIVITDELGDTLFSEEIRVTPKEQGREYYETVMGGTDWDALPKSSKTRYAGSERNIRENEEIVAKRAIREEEDRVVEEADRIEMAALRAQSDDKLAAIKAEQDAADKIIATRNAKNARKLELQESYEKADRLQAEYDEAVASGDTAEANRVATLQDAHEEASMEVLAFTPDEKKDMEAKTDLRQKIADQINREANFAAVKEDLERTQNDPYKDVGLEGASFLSMGAQQQLDLAKSNRSEDRLLSKTKHKDIAIERMLANPDLSADERDILIDLADMSSLQTEGALEKKAANNRIVAAGYAIDGAMLLSGGIGNAVAATGAKVAGTVVASKVAAKVFAKGLTQGAGLKTAGVSALKVGGKVADDVAAKLMKIGQYDLKTAASKKVIEKAVTRSTTKQVLAAELEKGIAKEVAEATARKAGEAAGKRVATEVGRDIAEKGLINVAASKGIGKAAAKVTSAETGLALEKALVKSRSVIPESVKNLVRRTATKETSQTAANATAGNAARPVAVATPRVTPTGNSARTVAKATPRPVTEAGASTVMPRGKVGGMPAENVGGIPTAKGAVAERASMPVGKVGGMGEMAKVTPRGMPDGKVGGILDRGILGREAGEVVTDPRPFGMLPRVMKTIQTEVNQAGLGTRIRAANDSAISKLRAGHPPKHVKLKSKTINDLDVQLGAPPGSQGEVGFFKPTQPKKLSLPEPPANANKLQLDRHGERVAELTSNQARLEKRFQQRLKEYGDNIADINKLVDDGLVSVENGVVVDRGLSNTRLGPDGKLRINRNGPQGGTGKGFTGDHDMWDITHPDGRPIIMDPRAPGFDADAVRRKMALQEALDTSLARTQHGPHKDWIPISKRDIGIDAKIRAGHNPGGEALLEFTPNRAPRTSYEIDAAGNFVEASATTENLAARLGAKAINEEDNQPEVQPE